MKNRKAFRIGAYVGAAALALLAGMGLWRAPVWAELGLSDAVRVEIQDPNAIILDVYTPNAAIPAALPVGIFSQVRPEPVRAAAIGDITSVVTALGGDLDTATGAITGNLQQVNATRVNKSGDVSDYFTVIDLAKLEYSAPTRAASKVASDVIRTVAIASTYYSSRNVANIVEGDSIPVEVSIFNASTVDDDGNGIPDASSLGGFDFVLFGEDGSITLIKAIDGSLARGTTSTEASHSYQSVDGPVQVTVESPTLDALQLADDTFDAFDTARLIVTIAGDAGDLVDSPLTADPIAEFELVDGATALPKPKNIFVRVAIAVATTARGVVTDWTFVDDLPGGLDYVATLSGPGIADALQNGTDVDAYTYGVTLSQSGEDIIATSGNDAQTEAWAEVDGGVTVNNEDNADDSADSRSTVNADDGDDTIRATFSIGSAIFGSNITPRAGNSSEDDDGNSFCFIATAAYGTPMAAEIKSLRDVRDGYLVNTAIGAAFVDAYYRISPPIARVVARSDAMKQGVRVVLAPVVAASRWFVATPGLTAALTLAIAMLGAAAIRGVLRHFRARVLN